MRNFKKLIYINFILFVGCTTSNINIKKDNKINKIETIRGIAKITVNNGEKIQTKKIIFISKKYSNLRIELLTFFNYPVAYLFLNNKNFTLYSPIDNKVWNGDETTIRNTGILPAFITTKLLFDLLFQDFHSPEYIKQKLSNGEKGITEIKLKNGITIDIVGKTENFSKKILISYKNYIIKLQIDDLDINPKINNEIFKPNLPEDVKIMRY